MLYNPPVGASDSNASYIQGNAALGVQGSKPPAIGFEAVQREIVAVIAAAGLTPSNGDLAQLLKALAKVGILTGVDTGTANALAVASLVPAVSALVSGQLLIITKSAAANTGATTATVMGVTGAVVQADGTALAWGDWPASAPAIVRYDGTQFRVLSIMGRNARSYSFDAAAPPSTPISLNPRDTLTVTFSSVSAIPLKVASAPGVYSVKLILSASNATNTDTYLYPNDTTYTSAFTYNDVGQTTASVISIITSTISSMFFDTFNGVGGTGPTIVEMVLSTYTTAKQSHAVSTNSSIAITHNLWNDTTTAWTSLGTLAVGTATSLSGVAIITRLA